MTDDDDFERASGYVDDIENRIERQYGANFDELTHEQRKDVVTQAFKLEFYPKSADKLTSGIEYVRGSPYFKQVTHKNGKVTIRDRFGRIFRWLK